MLLLQLYTRIRHGMTYILLSPWFRVFLSIPGCSLHPPHHQFTSHGLVFLSQLNWVLSSVLDMYTTGQKAINQAIVSVGNTSPLAESFVGWC